MEIKKEDFVRFRIVNTFFYALPCSYFDDKITPEEAIKEEIAEVIKPTKEELEAILKAEKKAKLLEELAKLEE